ncbi:sensor domain-containing diguanylate cyclase [Desulfovibrio sp. JC022]|uniref:sensor domain-containing diguanylate cyclase n=1 Tax=Desulfovibrio sp. JC022 TaxID=2593642 RepID=UPI0013D58636|nr:sensor domain-containing diguanylate cyclase [Desulfovibrio sp. JC022]NDV24947.1 sensor domain-containing diguanylate cyclase [Desulfovibrio sp. JC022]
MVNDPFHKEQRLLDKSAAALKDGEGSEVAAKGVLNSLVKGYRKLLRQSRRLVTMGDRMQMTLNEVNRNLTVSEQKFRGIFENVTEGIYRCTAAGEIVEANPALAAMFGYDSPASFVDEVKNIKALFCNPKDYARYQESLETGFSRRLEVTACTPAGKNIWAEISASIMHNSDDSECSGIVGVLTDITERRSMMEELCRLARTDSMTGLWNRGYFMELGNREVLRSIRNMEACSMLLIDVDFFKKVNDRYGHDVGDKVLIELAGIMSDSVRETDLVARIGGEEFVALLPGTSMGEARNVAGRMAQNVRKTVIETGKDEFSITISMGLSTLCLGDDLERIMKNADIALYAAKKKGRDRVEEYRDNSTRIYDIVQSEAGGEVQPQ